MRFLVLAALAGCVDYAHTSTHNAPGVIDLATPIAHENGDPARFEPSALPGADYLTIFASPYLIGGRGRTSAAGETGLEMRFEKGDELLPDRAFAITVGAGFIQWHDNQVIPGAFYAELDDRFLIGGLPFDLGAGPALYTQGAELGAQVSLRIPLVVLRVRYMPDTHTEVMAGLEIPIPFFFSRSK